jgi:hypothetical protein
MVESNRPEHVPMMEPANKIDVKPAWWDNLFAPSSSGMRYRDRFVPAYDRPTRGVWRYDGRDEEFSAGESWRDAYRSVD